MNFGEQIKGIRVSQKLTQEQMAQRLHVTRQAVSNWENNKNLPDIEMIISIASEFQLSLDQLILGGSEMNNMTEKLIQDGSETRRAKLNLINTVIGAVLLVIGTACLILKGMTVEYIDARGILHENFFLIPIGFLFLFAGVVTFLVLGIRNRQSHIGILIGVICLFAGSLMVLIAGNSGRPTAIPGIVLVVVGMVSFLWSCLRR